MYRDIFEKIKFAYLLDDQEIAEKLNISIEEYQKILDAKELPYNLLMKIKSTFNVSLEYLFLGNLTKDDEKLLNKPLDEFAEQKLKNLGVNRIKEQIFLDGFGEYWEKLKFDDSLYLKTHGKEPITVNPFSVFDSNNLDFWDYFKKNNFPISNPHILLSIKNEFRAKRKNFSIIDSQQFISVLKAYDYFFASNNLNWENVEIFIAKYGFVSYLVNDIKDRVQIGITPINPKWIDRCFAILKGEKLKAKKILTNDYEIEICIGPINYSYELIRLTNGNASNWDYELINKILEIGGLYLKQKVIGQYENIRIELEPDYVMTEFIKFLVEKNKR